jgi:hypothetical protein
MVALKDTISGQGKGVRSRFCPNAFKQLTIGLLRRGFAFASRQISAPGTLPDLGQILEDFVEVIRRAAVFASWIKTRELFGLKVPAGKVLSWIWGAIQAQ